MKPLLALVLALAAACSSQAPAENERPTVLDVDRALDVRLGGAIEARFAGEHAMRFITRTTEIAALEPATLATASTMQPIRFRPGRGFVVGVSVVGGYGGDGTYIIEPREGEVTPSPGATVNLSVVRIEIYDLRAEPPALVRRFENRSRCRVRVAENASVGDVRCARMVDPGGAVASLVASWG